MVLSVTAGIRVALIHHQRMAMLNKIRFFLPALLCAAAAHALVTPNPASLLSTKKILVIRGTDAVSSEHGGARGRHAGRAGRL
jgi:hypothetical protein